MQAAPERFRFTPLSLLVILLMGLVWPLLSFYFLDSQLGMADDVADPASDIYYPTMVIQLITLLLILIAVRSERVGVDDLGLARFSKWTIVQAAVFFIAANLTLLFLQLLIAGNAPGSFADVKELLPHTGHEKVVWVILCLVVAFCEEVVFRGYLISRITRLARGRVWIGIILASLSFASGHLYQGVGGFVLIFVYGLMFSALYIKTGSLYPGIIAHFVQDALVVVAPDLAG